MMDQKILRQERKSYVVFLVLLIYFVISLLTNILGPIIPEIIRSFSLSLTAAALLPFAFFIAYGLTSIPAGILIETYSEKTIMLSSFVMSFCGALAFAILTRYSVAIVSLFIIGIGMAMLQVALNPLLRVAGGEEHFAFNSTLVQLVFGSASFLSPHLYTYLVNNLGRPDVNNILLEALRRVVPPTLPWISLYWIFAGVSLITILIIGVSRLPKVERIAEEQAGSWTTHLKLFRSPVVLLFFASTFFYVGSEQGTANWMSQFLATYHHFDPRTVGANAVSWFWGLMTIGCLLGLLLLKLFDSRKVLIVTSGAALLLLSLALFGSARVSVIAFPGIGLFASMMWPIIISLGLNSVAEHHGTVSGILCTGIAGGAVVPLLIGQIGDHWGLRAGMTFLYISFGWVFGIGFWAKPLISNQKFGELNP
jgi:FHS family L-fucose permease-like MFS transporter